MFNQVEPAEKDTESRVSKNIIYLGGDNYICRLLHINVQRVHICAHQHLTGDARVRVKILAGRDTSADGLN